MIFCKSLWRALPLGLLLFGVALPAIVPAHAQNVVCPIPAPGDNSNKCAPTAFVQAAIAASPSVSGPGSSTDRTIPTFNGVAGNLLRSNPTVGISAAGALTIDAGFGPTSVLYVPPNFSNSSLMLGNGGTNLVHNAGTFTATITGTDMNVTVMTTGTVPVEPVATATLSGSGVTVGTQIRAQVSGATGGVGHYTVSPSQTVASPTAMTAISLQGYYNTFCGLTTFLNATTASYNTGCGFEVMEFCTICFANTGFGEATLIYNISGNGNTFNGWKAGLGTPGIGMGDYSTGTGYASGWASGNVAPTFRNSSYGAFSLSCAALATNDTNAFGYNAAGVYCSPGPGLFLGTNAAPSLTSGAGNFIAGANQAGSGLVNGSNDLILGTCIGLSASLSNMVQLCDGAGNVAFRNDSNRDTYLGDGATGRKVYNYFASAANNAGTTADSSGTWSIFTGTSAPANRLSAWADGSITIGVPTGLNKGLGTLNLQGSVYDNGTAPSGTAGSGYVQATAGTLTNASLATRLNKGVFIIGMSAATGMTVTGTVAETTLATIAIPGNTLGANGTLRITAQFSKTGTAGTVEPRIKFGGTAYMDNGAAGATVLSGRMQTEIHNRNATNSQIGTSILQGNWGVQVTSASITTALDTTTSQNVTFTCQLGNTGDTCELSSYTVEVLSP